MSALPGTTRSVMGTRSALYINADYPFYRTSPRSVAIGPGGFLSAAADTSASAGGIDYWPWAEAVDFDKRFNIVIPTPASLPVNQVNFNMGEESYLPTDDGVPGTSRMRRKCSGSYSFATSFPLVISGGTWATSVYQGILNGFLKNTLEYPGGRQQPRMACMRMATSQQLSGTNSSTFMMYPVVLESFTADAMGIGSQGNAPAISCQMTTRGIFYNMANSMDTQLAHSFPKPYSGSGMSLTSGYTRDGRYLDPATEGDDPIKGGGRLANIKDCTVSLDGATYDQVVKMNLSITHTLDFPSHSNVSAPFSLHLINYAQSVYLTQRVVKGSFSFLASNAQRGLRNISGFPVDSADKSTAYGLRAGGSSSSGQWSSPMYVSFGPLSFNMPAVYWQPLVQDVSPGSSLVTINFIARSDIVGGTEFI